MPDSCLYRITLCFLNKFSAAITVIKSCRLWSAPITLITTLSLSQAVAAKTVAQAFADHKSDLLFYTWSHLQLVFWSMLCASLIGIVCGVVLSRPFMRHQAERWMQLFNLGNTVPAIAVLAFALLLFGIGNLSAIFALTLASMLPIARNTYDGLCAISPDILESAKGVGMRPVQSLFSVEAPAAMPVVIGGIRTALAINVGTAPLVTLIGADSLGSLIFPAIYLNDTGLLLIGGTLTALLALVLDGLVFAGSHLMQRTRIRVA